jgi:uncharacterized protein (TIGR03084 family)
MNDSARVVASGTAGVDVVAAVRADLWAEQRDFYQLLATLDSSDWDRPTPAPGWQIRHQAQHVAFGDEAAALAILAPDQYLAGWLERSNEPAIAESRQLRAALAEPAQLLARLQSGADSLAEATRGRPAHQRIVWAGRELSLPSHLTGRLMEVWAHGQDIADALTIDRVPTMRLRHIAWLGISARAHSYAVNGVIASDEPVRLELSAPDGSMWTVGSVDAANRITGSMVDFCLVASRRRHWTDTGLRPTGRTALEWLAIVQAYAGPAGPGRHPGQFKRSP